MTPGRYVLTGDLNATDDDACLVVQADNVTVDGDGYAIRGDGPESIGIAVPGEEAPPQNLTVRNVDLDGHGTGVSVEPFRTTENRGDRLGKPPEVLSARAERGYSTER